MRPNGWALAAALALAAAPAAGQTTGTPVFTAPERAYRNNEIAFALSDPGAGFALETLYHVGRGSYDFGFRAGLADASGPGSGTRLLGGVDFRTRIFEQTEEFPLDGALTLGLGVNVGDGIALGYLPVGVSLGRRLQPEGSRISVLPYLHPVLVPTFGDVSEVLFAIGVGVDVRFSPRVEARLSGALGDYEGIGFGVAFLR